MRPSDPSDDERDEDAERDTSGAEERLRQHLRARLPENEAEQLLREKTRAGESPVSEQHDCEPARPVTGQDDEEGGGDGES